jgi:hypothetical protein
MDQERMIKAIVEEAHIQGDRDEKLPYPITGNALSKMDCPTTPEEKLKCSKYPYRKVVGQLMYGMVRTMVTIMYALNILSRYGNNPGPRYIEFLKHLLRFQCDADLGGNLDNKHSQTS